MICVWTAGWLIISLQRALMNSLLCGEMCSTGNNNVTASDWFVKPCKHVVLFRATVKDIEFEEKHATYKYNWLLVFQLTVAPLWVNQAGLKTNWTSRVHRYFKIIFSKKPSVVVCLKTKTEFHEKAYINGYLETVKDVLPSFTQLFCWVRDVSQLLYFKVCCVGFHTPQHKTQASL